MRPFHLFNFFLLKKIILLLFLLITNGMINTALGQTQDDQKQLYIETKKGKGYLGLVLDKSNDHVLIKTKKGKTRSILFDEIRSVTEAKPKQIHGREYWPKQAQAILQNGTPNAFNIKEGEIHLLNSYGILNQVSVGLTNNLSMTLGASPIGLFSQEPSLIWMAPKYSFPRFSKWFHVGVGINFLSFYESKVRGNPDLLGYPYVVVTLGNPNINISYSIGASYYNYGREDSEGVNTISSSIRTGKRTYFKTESYFFKYDRMIDYTLTWVGLKHVWTRFSMDYGVLLNIEPGYGTYVIPLPFLSVSYMFKNAPSNIHLVK